MVNLDLKMTDADFDVVAERVAARLADQIAKLSPENGQPLKLLYSEADAASALGVSKFTLKAWRHSGFVPCHSAQPVRYSRDDLDAAMRWLHTRGNGDTEPT